MARDILLSVEIMANPSTLFEAITTGEGLASFWTPFATAEPTPGSEARFEFTGAPVPLRMQVEKLEAVTGVEWKCLGDFPNWQDTRVEWGIQPGPTEGGTTVMFKHTGFPDAQPEAEFSSVAYTWATVLGALKAYAETGVPAPALG